MLGRLLQVSPAHLCSVQCLSALFNKCLGVVQFSATSKECICAASIFVSSEQNLDLVQCGESEQTSVVLLQ